jgi:hypothetical protein
MKSRVATGTERWVGTAAIAEHIGKPISWVENNADRLRMPRVRLGKQWRYRISDVDTWLVAQAAAS